MTLKLFVISVVLTSLFILGGCNCACRADATTCPASVNADAAH